MGSLLFFFILCLSLTSQAKEREIELEWAPSLGAQAYEIILSSQNSEKTIRKKLETTATTVNVEPGTYELRIRSYDQRGVPGEWGAPSPMWVPSFPPQLIKPQKRVFAKNPETENLLFQWEEAAGADHYVLEVTNSEGKPIHKLKSVSASVTLPLSVAQSYQWNVRPMGPNGEEGPSSEVPGSFVLFGPKLAPVAVNEPASWYVRELNWKKDPKHAQYNFRLLRKDDKKNAWRVMRKGSAYKETRIDFPANFPGGNYRFEIQAQAPLRQSSSVSRIEFGVIGGDRSEEAEQNSKLLANFDKPSSFYLIASYLITQMDYSSFNYDAGYIFRYDALGGTGRLGLGYQKPQSPFGFFGIVDYSGFVIDEKVHTFTSTEFHAVQERYISKTRFRWGGGMYFKELPETNGTSSSTINIATLSALGVHGGAELWHPITLRLGLQLNARLYYPLSAVETPNGGELVAQPSYQFGLMGSYRIGISTVGFLGYALRQDSLGYKTKNSTISGEDTNDVQIKGHYLNLLLEWAF